MDTKELFLFKFFHILKKKSCCRISEAALKYLTLTSHLRNLMSTIMKSCAYCTYKVLTVSREDSGS